MFFKTLKLFISAMSVCAAAAWAANNGGKASVEWLGYRVSTSVPVAIISAALAAWLLGRMLGLLGLLRHPLGGSPRARDEDSLV